MSSKTNTNRYTPPIPSPLNPLKQDPAWPRPGSGWRRPSSGSYSQTARRPTLGGSGSLSPTQRLLRHKAAVARRQSIALRSGGGSGSSDGGSGSGSGSGNSDVNGGIPRPPSRDGRNQNYGNQGGFQGIIATTHTHTHYDGMAAVKGDVTTTTTTTTTTTMTTTATATPPPPYRFWSENSAGAIGFGEKKLPPLPPTATTMASTKAAAVALPPSPANEKPGSGPGVVIDMEKQAYLADEKAFLKGEMGFLGEEPPERGQTRSWMSSVSSSWCSGVVTIRRLVVVMGLLCAVGTWSVVQMANRSAVGIRGVGS